jgi:class 3 adenylate cyclase/tetratricopeptide (TPR) repeat protein
MGRSGSGQRRHVTVMFADISGSSEHAERLEAEDYSLVLEQFRRYARDVIPRHGGSIARLQGDGLLALFGHLQPQEDDGRRAAEAALELHAAVAQLSVGRGATTTFLTMHSGIHAGLVLVIEGDIERGRYDVVGEVPNTAARLCSLAASGEIWVSQETLGPQAHFFGVTPMRGVPIRGRSLPLDVLRIEGRARVERRIDAAARRGVVPFVGRQPALDQLHRAAWRAHEGLPTALIVVGEPGIGKSRLIQESLVLLPEASFFLLRGYCESYLSAEPLQPFLQVLRGLLDGPRDASPGDLPEPASLGLGFLPVEVFDDLVSNVRELLTGRERISASERARAIVALVTLLAGHRTLVMALDDWQWADDASRQVLDLLQAKGLPLLTVLAMRTGSVDESTLVGAQTLRLEPLEPQAAQSAISAWMPEVEPFLAQEIYRQSGGSPLFIEELCHAAAADGNLPTTPHNTGVAWINALVASRLARLPVAQAELLRMAAVAGLVFSTALLRRLAGAGASSLLLEALTANDFLVKAEQAGSLRFKHAITREAVYATVDAVQRKALHLRVAESLESLAGRDDAFDALEALSYHYDAAGISERAAYFAEAAGDKALAAMALDRARAQYMTALAALDTLPVLAQPVLLRWCSIAQKLGQTCVFDPLDVSHGLRLFERAAQLARESGDANALARAEYWLGYVNYGKGRPRAAVRHCEAALGHAQSCGDARLVAQVQATLGQSLASAGRYERALPLLHEAVQSKRQQSRPGSGTAIGSAYTLGRLGYTLGDMGRFDEAGAAFEESLHLLGDKLHSVRASVRELMCVVHLWRGEWAQAQAAGLEGADIALRCRSRYLTAMGRALGACGGWALDGSAQALQLLRESTQWIESRGGAVSTSLNHGWLVRATATLGLEDEMRQHAARLFSRVRAQDRHGEGTGCRALARWFMHDGQHARAFHYLDRADQVAELRSSPREAAVNQLARAQLSAIAGQAPGARSLAEQAGEAFERMGMDWYRDRSAALIASV